VAAQLRTHLEAFGEFFDGKEISNSQIHAHLNEALDVIERQCKVADDALIHTKQAFKKRVFGITDQLILCERETLRPHWHERRRFRRLAARFSN